MSVNTDINSFLKDMRKLFKKSVSNKEMQLLGEKAIEIIVKRTRLGDGVTARGGKKKKFKAFKKSYRNFRKRYESKLDGTTSVTKRNNTFSGQLLRSMKVIKAVKGKVVVGPNDETRSKTFKGEASKTNAEVAGYLVDMGRAFNNLSKPEIKQLTIFYRRTFTDLVKKNVR